MSRHPQSNGRSNTIDPLPVLPDLTPVQLQPMDARWVAGYTRWGTVLPYDIFRGWTAECTKLFPDYPQHLRVAASGNDLRNFPWVPRTLKRSGLDGRAAVAIISATEFWGTCITLHRTIHYAPGDLLLTVSFSDFLLHRSRKYIDLSTLPEMASAVSLILAVDAERVLRRAIEHGITPEVTIKIHTADLPDDLRHYFADEIAETLRRRVVAIEPAGFSATVAVEVA